MVNFDDQIILKDRSTTRSTGAGRPAKTREIHNHHMDSTVWNAFEYRDTDIVVASYAKSGTTWVQQIVGQLLFDGNPEVPVADISPWLDLRFPSAQEKLAILSSQRHRRFLKTHLPLDALVYSENAKYIYIARDARDVVWSLYNHHSRANQLWYSMLNETPGLVGPKIVPPTSGVYDYWLSWLHQDGFPFWSYWENISSWWRFRHMPNIYLIHYSDLLNDLSGMIEKIATFLEIAIRAETKASIVKHCQFDWMRAYGANSIPLNGAFWDDGVKTFIHKGRNRQWASVLSNRDVLNYKAESSRRLGLQASKWTMLGGEDLQK